MDQGTLTDVDVEDVEAEEVVMEDSFARQVSAGRLLMKEAGAGLITVEGPTDMEQSGAGLLVADGGANMYQSGAGVVVANSTIVKEGFAGIVFSKETNVSEDSTILITGLGAVIVGVVAGVVFGVLAGLADYGVRSYYRD